MRCAYIKVFLFIREIPVDHLLHMDVFDWMKIMRETSLIWCEPRSVLEIRWMSLFVGRILADKKSLCGIFL